MNMNLSDDAKSLLVSWCNERFSGEVMAPSNQYFIDLVVVEFSLSSAADVKEAIAKGTLDKGLKLYYEKMAKVAKNTKMVVRGSCS
ncbi:hypothetical protein [Aliivibrio salmonicida]|uniref:hypothetical protein n=1 Tax=Aliivibrio salmonicida TaxID=40269 RepID=UPI003D0FDF19